MAKMARNVVYDIHYECRPPCDPEPGVVRGFWTGQVDTWGKRTIVQVPAGKPYYLFPDEIVDLERVGESDG